MEIPVVIEPLPEGGFRARGGGPFSLAALGETPGSALRNLRGLVDHQIAAGALWTVLNVPAPQYGPHAGAGIYRDDPLFDPWQEEIAAYRRKIDDDPEIP